MHKLTPRRACTPPKSREFKRKLVRAAGGLLAARDAVIAAIFRACGRLRVIRQVRRADGHERDDATNPADDAGDFSGALKLGLRAGFCFLVSEAGRVATPPGFGYMVATWPRKAKRPTLEDWPKCLNFLVGALGLEPRTN